MLAFFVIISCFFNDSSTLQSVTWMNQDTSSIFGIWNVFTMCRSQAWCLAKLNTYSGPSRTADLWAREERHQLGTEPSEIGIKDYAHPCCAIMAPKHKSAVNLRNLRRRHVVCLIPREFVKVLKYSLCYIEVQWNIFTEKPGFVHCVEERQRLGNLAKEAA